ncbi:hypothetical protein VTO42DRAFT_4621 [Malbranchea cinnamomea]
MAVPPKKDYRIKQLQAELQREYQPSPASSEAASIATSIDASTPGGRTPTTFAGTGPFAPFDSEGGGEGPEEWTAESESDAARGSCDASDYAGYRIRCLEANLQDPEVSETQKQNLRLAIDMYRRHDRLPKWDGLLFFQDGKLVGAHEVDREREYWFEGTIQHRLS